MGALGVAALTRRKLAGRFHPWPDFIIIGAMKAGTSSLYSHLAEQPGVVPARRKEVRYYDFNYANGPAWYRSHFPRHGPDFITGESSPYYMFHPLAPLRAAADLPNVRLIALLRNPVERAYSAWANWTRKGYERLSFEDALAHEEKVLPEATAQLIANPLTIHRRHPHHVYSYRARGRYLDQLVAWTHHVPRERLLAVISERLFTDSAAQLARIHSFLGLPEPVGTLPVQNVSQYAAIDPRTRAELADYYRQPNAELAEWLGEDPGWD